jgi:anti-sigma B factor antagonist
MDVVQKKQGKALILSVSGRLDAVTSPIFEDRLVRLIEGEEGNIILDLGQLDYLSSAGLRAILSVAKKIPRSEQMIVCNLSGMIREVFSISGFDGIFPIADSIEEALGKAS